MDAEYARAIETRMRWLTWSGERGRHVWEQLGFGEAMPSYRDLLARGDTYVMTAPFCRLVDHARTSAPDDMAFDVTWPISPQGFLWIAEPVRCPSMEKVEGQGHLVPNADGDLVIQEGRPILVHAIGWRMLRPGTPIANTRTGQKEAPIGPGGAVHVATFQRFADYEPAADGFGCWSYVNLQSGERLGERLARFEDTQMTGRYADTGWGPRRAPGEVSDRRRHPLHELRWVYAAFHLMAQRLSATVRVNPDRATRRRMAVEAPHVEPEVKVVTLRRLTEKREHQGPARDVKWTCQWEVQGHWRHLAEKVVWIDTFVKGPAGLPFKRPTKLFVARR